MPVFLKCIDNDIKSYRFFINNVDFNEYFLYCLNQKDITTPQLMILKNIHLTCKL